MKIVVTGATGYIGERFVKLSMASGYEVVALCRRPPESFSCDWIPYNLSEDQMPVLPVGTEVVFHLATSDFSNGDRDSVQDILAAELLIAATEKVGAKFIFISSQTARSDAPTIYGRTKWDIEQLVLAGGGCVVRPGQVYGGAARGLFGELIAVVQRMSILPAFLPAPRVQPIHVDDLSLGLLRMVERVETITGILCLGSPKPVTFTKLLYEIAHVRLGLRRFFVPIPVPLISIAVRLVGKRTGLERLRSLFELPMMNTAPDLDYLSLQLRPLNSGMYKSGDIRRRRLLMEGFVLSSYILGDLPNKVMLRRYVQAIEKLRGGSVLALPNIFEKWPALLALIDSGSAPKTAWEKEFLWRLDGATILAEATPLGAKKFLGVGGRHGSVISLFGVFYAVVSEVIWRLLSVVFAPIVRIVLTRSS